MQNSAFCKRIPGAQHLTKKAFRPSGSLRSLGGGGASRRGRYRGGAAESFAAALWYPTRGRAMLGAELRRRSPMCVQARGRSCP